MSMVRKAPPRRSKRQKPKQPPKPSTDPLANMLASTVRKGHGEDQAATLDQAEDLGSPRGWIGTRNIAYDRSIGNRGMPSGRVIEMYGMNASGKSTAADQVGAQCQAEGGIYVLADTERKRDRRYMRNLGVQDDRTVWIGGQNVEMFFEEIETIARRTASTNVLGWKQALDLAGYKTPALVKYVYRTFDPNIKDKKQRQKRPVASFTLFDWTMDQAAALKRYQQDQGLPVSGLRDEATRNLLKPVVIYGPDGEPFSGDIRNKAFRETVEATRSEEISSQLGWLGHSADRPVVACWDSVGGTATRLEMEESAGDLHVGVHARVIKQNLRRLIQLIDDAAITLICVNQQYHKIDHFGHGPKKDTFGGEGIKYHACIRAEFVRVGKITMPGDNDREIGQISEIRIVKNGVGVPFRKEQFGLIYGRGADNMWAIYHDLKARGIIRVNGSWSSFTDPTMPQKAFQGWTGLANMVAGDLSLYEKLAAIYMEGLL